MAALPDPFPGVPEIVDIRRLNSRELSPALLEETVEWERELSWDFAKSAELIRRFADQRGLSGVALMDRGEVAGYGYAILEDDKGLIGDIYIRPPWRAAGPAGCPEVRLFRTLLDCLIATPGVRRVESQLLLMEGAPAKTLERERCVRIFERLLMRLDGARPLPRRLPPRRYYIETWGDHHYDAASTVISLAYVGHIDSLINDQYCTFAGARRFLHNVVQYPGCGVFYRPGSFVAVDVFTGWVAGISLCSFVGDRVGHITQICVTPQAKGTGLGYEMLRRSVEALRMAGARRITLTVTAANDSAVRLYERCGFEEMRRFFAYVWQRV
jgi:ribosomal protein S18 acetylase RimI-like enzyme